MAALKITPGLISKLTTSLSSTWFRGVNPSAISQMFLSRGYGTDAVLGTWVEGYRESFEPLAKETGMSESEINKMKGDRLVVTYAKSGNDFKVEEVTEAGVLTNYQVSPKGIYNRHMPLFKTNTQCTATYKHDGLLEVCMLKHPRTGQPIFITSYRYVDKDLLIESSVSKATQVPTSSSSHSSNPGIHWVFQSLFTSNIRIQGRPDGDGLL